MPESFDPYLSWLGIRDPERPPNHYRLLGVAPFENDPEILAHAADRQMSHVRTFQAGRRSAESQRLLNELATAKVCLLNPKKKADYDAALQAKEAAAAAPPLAVPPPLPVEGHPPRPRCCPRHRSTPPEFPPTRAWRRGPARGLGLRPRRRGHAEPPAPAAAKSGSPLVSAAIVVLTLVAIALGRADRRAPQPRLPRHAGPRRSAPGGVLAGRRRRQDRGAGTQDRRQDRARRRAEDRTADQDRRRAQARAGTAEGEARRAEAAGVGRCVEERHPLRQRRGEDRVGRRRLAATRAGRRQGAGLGAVPAGHNLVAERRRRGGRLRRLGAVR